MHFVCFIFSKDQKKRGIFGSFSWFVYLLNFFFFPWDFDNIIVVPFFFFLFLSFFPSIFYYFKFFSQSVMWRFTNLVPFSCGLLFSDAVGRLYCRSLIRHCRHLVHCVWTLLVPHLPLLLLLSQRALWLLPDSLCSLPDPPHPVHHCCNVSFCLFVDSKTVQNTCELMHVASLLLICNSLERSFIPKFQCGVHSAVYWSGKAS